MYADFDFFVWIYLSLVDFKNVLKILKLLTSLLKKCLSILNFFSNLGNLVSIFRRVISPEILLVCYLENLSAYLLVGLRIGNAYDLKAGRSAGTLAKQLGWLEQNL